MCNAGRFWPRVLLGLLLGQAAMADEWQISGAFKQSVEYDDNIGLRAQPTQVFGYTMQPSITASWRQAFMETNINGRGDIRRYDDQRWDCENFSTSANQRYQHRQQQFSLAFSYGQSCSYAQQIADSGLLRPNNQMESLSISPIWSWQWTPRAQLTLTPTYSQSTYSFADLSSTADSDVNFRNTKAYSLDLSEKYQWNRQLILSSGLYVSGNEFNNPGGALTQKAFGFQLGAEYQLNRQWTITAGGGGRWVQRPSATGRTGAPLFTEIANLALVYSGQHRHFALSYSRSVSPSSLGQLLEFNSVSMKYDLKLTREWSLNLGADYSQNQAVGQSLLQAGRGRSYYSASAGLAWKFAREWQLSFSYRYRWQRYDSQDVYADGSLADERDSNTLMLYLNYNWDGFKASS